MVVRTDQVIPRLAADCSFYSNVLNTTAALADTVGNYKGIDLLVIWKVKKDMPGGGGGGPCGADQANGRVNQAATQICHDCVKSEYTRWKSDPESSPAFSVATTFHEIGHAMAKTQNLNPCDEFNANCTSSHWPVARTYPAARSYVAARNKVSDIKMKNTPRMLEHIRHFTGCPTLLGYPWINPFSHPDHLFATWDDVMPYGDEKGVSVMYFAELEDTGVWRADWRNVTFSDSFDKGKPFLEQFKAGCGYFDAKYPYLSNGSVTPGYEYIFCDRGSCGQGHDYCSPDHKSKAPCRTTSAWWDVSAGKNQTAIIAEGQMSCSLAATVEDQGNASRYGESSGDSARCFRGTLEPNSEPGWAKSWANAFCFESRCTTENLIEFRVATTVASSVDRWALCPEEGGRVAIAGFSGFVECPHQAKICPASCPCNCSGRGECNRETGICFCDKEYIGVGCEVETAWWYPECVDIGVFSPRGAGAETSPRTVCPEEGTRSCRSSSTYNASAACSILNITTGVSIGSPSSGLTCTTGLSTDSPSNELTSTAAPTAASTAAPTAAPSQASKVVGSLTLTVSDCATFVAQSGADSAIKSALAIATSADVSSISVQLMCPSRRLASAVLSRRLGTSVAAAYEIAIPAGSSTVTATSVVNAIKSSSTTAMTSLVTAALKAANLPLTGVSVATLPAPAEKASEKDATPSSGMTSIAAGRFEAAISLQTFVLLALACLFTM
ncbi:unnamed protein product [Polarella glacialis]|uniref:EGF-like domain-containing protein n=1 Tax=Polarella glacialis TaxID=89957 RepID=A0A813GFW7_POLGL|nr:unnamed protein product [Polarella glacialis]